MTDPSSEREILRALLMGTITEETDPNAWRDDVYLFSMVAAWRQDTAWMLEQMANEDYPVRLRVQIAFWNLGESRGAAFAAIAGASARFRDTATAAAALRAALTDGASPDDETLQESLLVLEHRDPDALHGILRDDRLPRRGRRLLIASASTAATKAVLRTLREPESASTPE